MKPDTKIVKIERGQFSPRFQVARAWITAASALVAIDPDKAGLFITSAICELKQIRNALPLAGAR